VIEFDDEVKNCSPEEPADPSEARNDPKVGQPSSQPKNKEKSESKASDETVSISKHRISDVSAVELAHRNKIHGSYEESEPPHAQERIMIDLVHWRDKSVSDRCTE